MKALLLMLFILLPLTIYCQENAEYKLRINSFGMGEDYNYTIELLRSENLMIVKKDKPGSLVLSTEDSLRVLNLLEEKGPQGREELVQIIERNKEYLIDSLIFQDDSPVFRLTDSFFQNRKRIKQNLEEKEDKRIILDGFMVKLTIDNFPNEVDELYVSTPTKESHPEIHRLISQTIKAYFSEAKKPILSGGI